MVAIICEYIFYINNCVIYYHYFYNFFNIVLNKYVLSCDVVDLRHCFVLLFLSLVVYLINCYLDIIVSHRS